MQRSFDFVHSTDEVRRLQNTALKIVIFLSDVYLHVLPTATKCSVHSTNEVRRSQNEVRRLRNTALKIVIFLSDVYLHVLPTATKCSVHSTNEVRRSQSEEVKRKH
ncbi:hypothetical protein TcasGA2_TC005287 [Tribolium castaneum]|uniref:Uncharacterized protein n=1 Tax=Tribolium castaneum TaxID=7070 RepID=D7GXK0_TRICA|nr:hypothetical protein TcasGA2_TC005287 [Tribolium castaneum]